jgi:di/tricarboxylate transporter
MTKILGQPSSIAAAQFRLMVPVSIISAFLNNTPLVIIMIPICLKWGKNNGISPAQLLVPLSFCSILGGTCTLIGTSTNLVVAGLYVEYYPDKPPIGLFDLGVYGVPVLFIGLAYIIVASQYLLPGGKTRQDTADPIDDDGTILLAARLTKWSPAAGTTVKRSGLRDTGRVLLSVSSSFFRGIILTLLAS